MLKLYHGDSLIGTITNEEGDHSNMCGNIELTTVADDTYRKLFSFLTSDDEMASGRNVVPFDESLLDNWFVESESGERKSILVPGVYDDGVIQWRF